jgi:hypothetical protein
MGKRIVQAGSGVTKFEQVIYDADIDRDFDEDFHEAFDRMVKAHNARWEAGGRTHFGFATVDAVKWARAQLKHVDRKTIRMNSHSKAELAQNVLRKYDLAQAAFHRREYDLAMGLAFEMARLWTLTGWKLWLERQRSQAARKAHSAKLKKRNDLAAAYTGLPPTMTVKEKHGKLAADFVLTDNQVKYRLRRHHRKSKSMATLSKGRR